MIYKCDRCSKEFDNKQSLKRHLSKKEPCELSSDKIELENKELRHKIELLEIELKYKNEILRLQSELLKNYNIEELQVIQDIKIIELNNFGNENLNYLKRNDLIQGLKQIINMTLPLGIDKKSKLKIDDFIYYGYHIKDLEIFRYFINLLFLDENHIENNTIKYNKELDKIQVHMTSKWYNIDKENYDQIIEKIIKKIQLILIDLKPFTETHELKHLIFYLGEDYTIKKNKISQKDYGLVYNSPSYTRLFSNILYYELSKIDIFNNHIKNLI